MKMNTFNRIWLFRDLLSGLLELRSENRDIYCVVEALKSAEYEIHNVLEFFLEPILKFSPQVGDIYKGDAFTCDLNPKIVSYTGFFILVHEYPGNEGFLVITSKKFLNDTSLHCNNCQLIHTINNLNFIPALNR